MNTIAPNLTALVGARLIAHGSSLLNLAKQPGSTVQILGAEKALFRALKTKHATAKYGLIYHASLIGQAAPKLKGKISRSLAAKTALAIRCDALGDNQDNSMGLENQAKLEARLRNLEGRELGHYAGSAKGKPKIEVSNKDQKKGAGALITAAKTYNAASDSILGQTTKTNVENQETVAKKITETTEESHATGENKEKKKKKKRADDNDTVLPDSNASAQADNEEITKKKKKKKKAHDNETVLKNSNASAQAEDEEVTKKKKKKKHSAKDVEAKDGDENGDVAENKKRRKENMLKKKNLKYPLRRRKRRRKVRIKMNRTVWSASSMCSRPQICQPQYQFCQK